MSKEEAVPQLYRQTGLRELPNRNDVILSPVQ